MKKAPVKPMKVKPFPKVNVAADDIVD
jgi:hypothetical protein